MLEIQEYNFVLEYKQGEKNVIADYFSRLNAVYQKMNLFQWRN